MKRILLLWLLGSYPAHANSFDFRTSSRLSPEDYLLGSYGSLDDPLFDKVADASLDLDIGIGSDCGQIDFRNTLKAALNNVLDEKYLQKLGNQLMAASPMLITCYFSPTWCAILKHARIRANFLAQLRLNQCKAINRFVDGRVEDFYKERSECVRNSIRSKNGNFEEAMEECQNFNKFDLKDWSGKDKVNKKEQNSILQSTAEWAGLSGGKAQEIVNLAKSIIGDDVIKKGNASVDYGPKKIHYSPRTYLKEIKQAKLNALCKDLVPKLILAGGPKANIYEEVSDGDLRDLSGSDKALLDRQTIYSLLLMPYQKRQLACRKLSDALALGHFNEDMGKTLDFISSKVGSNPHLPPKQKLIVDRKRRAFKDQIQLTLSIENQRQSPLSKVLFLINKEGAKYRKEAAKRELSVSRDLQSNQRIDKLFFDCADGIACN